MGSTPPGLCGSVQVTPGLPPSADKPPGAIHLEPLRGSKSLVVDTYGSLKMGPLLVDKDGP